MATISRMCTHVSYQVAASMINRIDTPATYTSTGRRRFTVHAYGRVIRVGVRVRVATEHET